MFVIRNAQIDQMTASMEQGYHERLRRLFRERFPGIVSRLDDDTLLSQIALGVERARQFGIQSGKGILAYLGLALSSSPAFHDDPKIKAFFEEKDSDPETKVLWFYERAVEKVEDAKAAGWPHPHPHGH